MSESEEQSTHPSNEPELSFARGRGRGRGRAAPEPEFTFARGRGRASRPPQQTEPSVRPKTGRSGRPPVRTGPRQDYTPDTEIVDRLRDPATGLPDFDTRFRVDIPLRTLDSSELAERSSRRMQNIWNDDRYRMDRMATLLTDKGLKPIGPAERRHRVLQRYGDPEPRGAKPTTTPLMPSRGFNDFGEDRFHRTVSSMSSARPPPLYMPIGRMGYGPVMSEANVSKLDPGLTPRQQMFRNRMQSLPDEEQEAFRRYHHMSDVTLGDVRKTRRRMTPPNTESALREKGRDLMKDYSKQRKDGSLYGAEPTPQRAKKESRQNVSRDYARLPSTLKDDLSHITEEVIHEEEEPQEDDQQ